MGLVEAKIKILEKLWEAQQPIKARDIAQKMNLGVAASTMHLLGLRKRGYVFTPMHGHYAITDLGKEIIGLPKIDKANADKILRNLPHDKAFHFYTNLHQYSQVIATSLADFCDKIQKIDFKSVEFHIQRKDFENWFKSLGDVELAKRFSIITDIQLHGEELKTRIHEVVKNRLEELRTING